MSELIPMYSIENILARQKIRQKHEALGCVFSILAQVRDAIV
jgi:hypothetical protein